MNISSSISSLNSNAYQFNTNAVNIANSTNDNYKATNTTIHEDTQNNITKTVNQYSNQPTDLNKDIVQTKSNTAGYTAQLKAIKMQDKMTGELINIIA